MSDEPQTVPAAWCMFVIAMAGLVSWFYVVVINGGM
jgi:hypothetical protein